MGARRVGQPFDYELPASTAWTEDQAPPSLVKPAGCAFSRYAATCVVLASGCSGPCNRNGCGNSIHSSCRMPAAIAHRASVARHFLGSSCICNVGSHEMEKKLHAFLGDCSCC